MNLLHPLLRPIIAVLLLLSIMQALRAKWSWRSGHIKGQEEQSGQPRLAVAHFMLGNTYPFTERDWLDTIESAEDTGLNALVLNLGPEEWQLNQARAAFSLLASRPTGPTTLKMFLSLDMNILPSSSLADANNLVDKIADLISQETYLRFMSQPLLSTFGGHTASFGGAGWKGFLSRLNSRIGEQVFFMPAFFMPPEDFMALPYVDGCFAWNNAWPMGNYTTNLKEDEPFLNSNKPYMAAVSPLFSTHYGTTGNWAFDKNWIYRSDDLLLPTRFSQLISVPGRGPDIIQVISWNDFGESHSIGPVLGAQPGSEAWTEGMDHSAFREMVKYFVGVWRDGKSEAPNLEIRVWGWWRTHPAMVDATDDSVGRPDHAEWAQDLLNFVVLLPHTREQVDLVVNNGPAVNHHTLTPGRANMVAIPFIPGEVSFEVVSRAKHGARTLLSGSGRRIDDSTEKYNYNMWTGSWSAGRSAGARTVDTDEEAHTSKAAVRQDTTHVFNR